ncbi:hypothetical protein TRICI_005047 [Trichomonascus ciferrii]|uniref:Galactose-1-phosphate uridylyltransferase n=1 Tax=Trichomonascus ciferrii TaxID=44093 RepID=A0A642UWS2_9ASCO|nr:hypothetical protein TRICI_005047 [Trichomonascus ciferrii]
MVDTIQWNEAHRRYNPLRKSWVLCSPHRTQRPWQGQQEKASTERRPEYDEKCYLCPGNTRAQGQANPQYKETFVFVNDFSAVKPAASIKDGEASEVANDELFKAEQSTGRCVVICFNPRHDLTLAQMSQSEITAVIRAWKEVYQSAVDDPEINHCQIFENKGAAMGCSNPHPHGQAWMTSMVPEEPAVEHDCLKQYQLTHNGRGMLEDYVSRELAFVARGDEANNRIVCQNDDFVALVPFWATWPFETMVISRRKVPSVIELTEQEVENFASILSQLTRKYDNLFETSFPYSMGLHQAATSSAEAQLREDGGCAEHLHLHFYPPLLRSASVKKFLVGFEMLGMPQRDITPERAAATLRGLDGVNHYLDNQ